LLIKMPEYQSRKNANRNGFTIKAEPIIAA